MRRRTALGVGSALLTTGGLAGCLGDVGSETTTASETATATTGEQRDVATTTADRPDGIYVQPFGETMSMQGTAASDDYEFGLMFTVPHTFWTVTGDELSVVEPTDTDAVHLMASVWDTETGTVLPETGLSVEISRDGVLVSEEVIYPMLSQPMSFHYGGNFELDGDGTYDVTVSVGGTNVRRTGDFAGRFGDPASVEIPLEFTDTTRREVSSEPVDRGGTAGALRPMDMMMPQAVLPEQSTLPGAVRGSGMTDDARMVVTTFEDAGRVDADGEQYLAVSARTRYNRYVLPAMSLSTTLARDGETVYEGAVERTLSPDLGYHYGAAVPSVQSGDDLTLSVTTPPQVARHEGYETAFLQTEPVEITLE